MVCGLAATVGLCVGQAAGVWDSEEPLFMDLRAVTSAADCAAEAPQWTVHDPTCDPWGRPYNYPGIWARSFAALGLGDADSTWLGFLALGTFGATAIALGVRYAGRTRTSGLLAAATLVSPPMVYAAHRANVDLLVFAIVAIALIALDSGRRLASSVGLTVATYLKVFPVGGLLTMATFDRRTWLRAAPVLLIGATALVLHRDEFVNAADATPASVNANFGVAVLPRQLSGMSLNPMEATAAGWAVTTALLAVIACFPMFRRRVRLLAEAALTDHTSTAWLLAGAGVLATSYLVGTSADYRLIFVAFTVLALLRCVTRETTAVAIALVGCQWLGSSSPWWPVPLPIQFIADLVLAGVVALLIAVAIAMAVRVQRHHPV